MTFYDLDRVAREICKGNIDQLWDILFKKVINELQLLERKTESTEIIKMIHEIARFILDSPTKEISGNTFKSKMAEMNIIHQYELEMSDIFLIRDNQAVAFQSRVTEHYFKMYLSDHRTSTTT